MRGETGELSQFNFKKGMREYNGQTLTSGAKDILVMDGIRCPNITFSYALPKESKFKIYISCLTTLNVEDHNRIPTTNGRLLHRIERDATARGYHARDTIQMWSSMRRGRSPRFSRFRTAQMWSSTPRRSMNSLCSSPAWSSCCLAFLKIAGNTWKPNTF